jgi:hypothetical protein
MADRIVRLTPSDDEIEQEWARDTGDELRDMTASRWHDGLWQLWVGLADQLREEPLESEMRLEMQRVLKTVPGVTTVSEGDREIWDVEGSPSAEDLIAAAGTVVDALAERAHHVLGY